MAINHTTSSGFFSWITGLIGAGSLPAGSIHAGRAVAVVLILLTSGAVAAQGIGGNLADRLRQKAAEKEPSAGSSDDNRSRLRLGSPGLSEALEARARRPRVPGLAADEMSTSGGFVFGNPPFDLAVLSPLFDPPDPEAFKRKGPVLKKQAEQAFRAGDHATALNLMFGHMAAEYDEALPTLQSVKFSQLLRRPVWSIRFGVSMWVRDGGIDDQDPMPIPPEGGTRRTSSRRSQNPLAAAMGNRGVASSLRNALGNSRRSRRPTDRNVDQEPHADDLVDAVNGTASDPESRESDQESEEARDQPEEMLPPEEATMLSESVNEELEQMLGMVAQVVGDAFNQRFQRGDYGALLIDVASPAEEEGGSAANTDRGRANSAGLNPDALRNRLRLGATDGDNGAIAEPATPSRTTSPPVITSADSLKMWNPGIVYVGKGASKDMIAQAQDAGLDVLLHFEVLLKPSRGDSVQNIARVRLINVATGKSIGVSKPIDNMDESQSAARGGAAGREYVEQRVENLLEILDRDVKVTDLPKLTPEVARRRLGQLMSSQPERSLRTLAEIRLYQMQQLITAEEVEMAFDIVGGNESLMFLHGSASDRAKMARAWAIGEAEKQES